MNEDQALSGIGVDKHIHSLSQVRDFSRREQWYLLFITIIGASIRLLYLYDKPFFGDEVGTLIYIEKDISYLLSHFAIWLSINYFIVMEKLVAGLFGKSMFSLGFVPLVAGVWTIPLTAFLAARFASPRIALIAATLTCMNPYLMEYSGIIRSYSLLTALSLLVMILFLKWLTVRSYKNGIWVGIGCYFLILIHPNGIYTVAYLLFIIVIRFFHNADKRKYFNSIVTILLPVSIALLCIFISYLRIFPEMSQVGEPFHETPPTSISYVPYIFAQYFSNGFYVWLSALCFITGILVSYKYEKPSVILLPSIFLPIFLMSVQGCSYFPWAYARYLIFLVPVVIVFIAEGVDYCSTKYFSGMSFLSAAAIVMLLILSWTPKMVEIFGRKTAFPWHHVARFIENHINEGDIILGSSFTEPFHLRPYFSKKPNIIQLHLNDETFRNAVNKPSANRIFFVTSSHFVETSNPNYHFGKTQVIVYERPRHESVLQVIRNDLVKRVKGGKELTPEFTLLYGNILDLNNVLSLTDDNFYYYILYLKCFELTGRQRNIPFNLQILEAQRFLKNLFNINYEKNIN